MIDSLQSQATDAGRLVGYGIRPRHRPANDTDYQALVLRFLADRDFERMVTAVASARASASSLATAWRAWSSLQPTTPVPPAPRRLYPVAQRNSTPARNRPTRHRGYCLPDGRRSQRSTRIVSISATQVYERIMRLTESSRGGSGETTRPRKTQSPKRSGTSCLACVPLTRPPTTGTLPTTCSVRSRKHCVGFRSTALPTRWKAPTTPGDSRAVPTQRPGRFRWWIVELFQSQHSAANEEAMP